MSDLVGNPEDWFSHVTAHIPGKLILIAKSPVIYLSWVTLIHDLNVLWWPSFLSRNEKLQVILKKVLINGENMHDIIFENQLQTEQSVTS